MSRTQAIVEELRREVIPYDEAVRHAPLLGGSGLDHSDFQAEDGVDTLPPYSRLPVLQRIIGNGTGDPNDPDLVRYGRIINPTVHITLGQFRREMNALIAEHGKPAQVVIEATRDMAKSAEKLNKIEKAKRGLLWRCDGHPSTALALRDGAPVFWSTLALGCGCRWLPQPAARQATPRLTPPLGITAGNRNMVLFQGALPPALVEDLLLFIGCHQMPICLTPLLMTFFYRQLLRPACDPGEK